MKDVYLKNPQMGDPASLDHKLAEATQNIEKLRLETQKFEVWRTGLRKEQEGEGCLWADPWGTPPTLTPTFPVVGLWRGKPPC